MSGWGAAIGAALDIGKTFIQNKQQNNREERAVKNEMGLMNYQTQNQKALNKQGQKLQMQTWKDTNYPAQMGMLKEAGLNPGPLYGMGGAGGATSGSQGGGTAQGGHAPAPQQLDINANLAQQAANIELTKAQTEKVRVEAENEGEGGYVRAESDERQNKIYQEGKAKFIENLVQRVRNEGYRRTNTDKKGGNHYGAINLDKNSTTGRLIENEPQKVEQELQNLKVEERAKEAGIELTEEQARQIYHKIIQGYIQNGIQALSAIQVTNIIKSITGKGKKTTVGEKTGSDGSVSTWQTTE